MNESDREIARRVAAEAALECGVVFDKIACLESNGRFAGVLARIGEMNNLVEWEPDEEANPVDLARYSGMALAEWFRR